MSRPRSMGGRSRTALSLLLIALVDPASARGIMASARNRSIERDGCEREWKAGRRGLLRNVARISPIKIAMSRFMEISLCNRSRDGSDIAYSSTIHRHRTTTFGIQRIVFEQNLDIPHGPVAYTTTRPTIVALVLVQYEESKRT